MGSSKSKPEKIEQPYVKPKVQVDLKPYFADGSFLKDIKLEPYTKKEPLSLDSPVLLND